MADETKSISSKIVLGLDVGTTTIKAMVINEQGQILGTGRAKTIIKVPEPYHEEIDHIHLWKLVTDTLKGCLKDANVSPSDITCMGLCTFRASFITWSRRTGKPFHNIITWRDKRAEKMANDWDRGLQLQILRLISGPAYMVTRNKAHQLNKNYHLDTSLCNIKLSWALQNISEVSQAAKENDLMFGTLDTWILYKLTGGCIYATEASNAITTGVWDMFKQEYSSRHLNYFGIPLSILPPVVPSGSPTAYGSVDPTIFEEHESMDDIKWKIPITAVLSDQGASAFGLGCIKKGDMKMTLGTGTFFHINTGKSPLCTLNGLWPVICWKQEDSPDFFAQGQNYGTNASLEWAQNMGLFQDPRETSDIAYSIEDVGDLCFVPAFHGLQEPITDHRAGCGFIGLSTGHGAKEMVRAVLESIAFGVKAITDRIEEQIGCAKLTEEIKADGGISNNDFVMQLIANLTGKSVVRMPLPDMSVIGVGLMAGMQLGVWSTREDISLLVTPTKVFTPTNSLKEQQRIICNFERWKKACRCFASFHDN